MVEEGIRWQVGNGSKIQVWSDKWLPCANMHEVIFPYGDSSPNLRVSDLIDHNLCCWKSGLLDALFLPFEVDVIKVIPLSSRLSNDKLIWAETQSGSFTVHSTYKVAMELSDVLVGGLSSK